ncbi:MAG: SUMF1/EgtB/PvdO family nonheme iron enzyme, partial [Treponema sp.]|nr:SUMF1/EgtB/PvdO family nonheme iron enzyme [Treponema sp.]
MSVSGDTFDGTTAITLSSVFIANRTVTIPNLWVCDHEVTQAEYESVMLYNPSQFKNNPANGETQENRPVESVSWYDAIMYCNRRSDGEGRTPCYKVNGNADTNQWGYTP